MSDLDTQIRDYFVATMPPVDASEVRQAAAPLSPPRRRRSALTVVLASAVAVLVLVGGVAFLALSGSGDPDGSDVAGGDGATYLGIPRHPAGPFEATVRYSDSGGDWFGDDPLASLRYLGPDEGVYLELIRFDSGLPGSFFAKTGEGSHVSYDGSRAASYAAEAGVFITFPADEGARLESAAEFGWNFWADRCDSGSVDSIREEDVAGRAVTHVACTTLRGAFEIQVDADTGVVIRSTTPGGLDLPLSIELGLLGWRTVELADVDFSPSPDAVVPAVPPPGVPTEELDRRSRGIFIQNEGKTAEDARRAADELRAELATPNTAAPELTAPLLGGGTFDLAERRGERVALVWWATWCAPSLDALEAADELAADRPDITFVGVDFMDDPESARTLTEAAGITVPIVDAFPLGDVHVDWQVEGCPTVTLVDEEGLYIGRRAGVTTREEILDLLDDAGW